MTTPEGWAWVDGEICPLAEARIPVTDRGFQFADSIYDTIRTYARRPFLLGDHLDRLRRSAQVLAIDVPWTDAELGAISEALMGRWSDDREASLRVVVTRGDGGAGLALPDPAEPRLVVMVRPLYPIDPRYYTEGAKLGRPPAELAKLGSIPAHVKSGSYLSNVLALRAVRERGAFEALLRGKDGSWAEATTSNLFVVQEGRVRTPGIGDQILPGITRDLLLTLARRDGLGIDEGPLFDADLEGADEVFLTSSIKEVLPISHVDGHLVGRGAPGPVTKRLMALYQEAVETILACGAERRVDAFFP